jgi:hypothetical protein
MFKMEDFILVACQLIHAEIADANGGDVAVVFY